jgi:hypothetical protein
MSVSQSAEEHKYDAGQFENIPDDLQSLPRWVLWKYEDHGKPKLDKVPCNSRTGERAKTNDPRTWSSFAEALAAYRRGGFAGVGFVFALGDGLVGIDLDGCRNPDNGQLETWAGEIVERLDSYTEASPSRTGVHLIARGTLPVGGRKKDKIEMYSEGRFFTVTGEHLGGTPTTIGERTAELAALHAEVFGKAQESAQGHATSGNGSGNGHAGNYANGHTRSENTSSDDEILEACRKNLDYRFAALFAGKWQGLYSSQSEADLALCSFLARVCGNNSEQIDRLFRRSGLYRPKWDKKHFSDGRTYGKATIAKALTSNSNEDATWPDDDEVPLGDPRMHAPRTHAREKTYRNAHEDHRDEEEPEAEAENEPFFVPSEGDAAEPFPTEVFPLPVRAFITAGATALVCPADLIGVHVLTLAGAAIGRSRVIEIKRGWQEYPVIFSAMVAPPGTKKSPALKLAATPFFRRQRDLVAEYEQQKATYARALAQYEIDLVKWKKSASKGTAEADQKPEEPEELRLAQVFTTDTTTEAAVVLQKNNPRGVACLSDELTAWARGFNQYKSGKGADRQHWLSFWSSTQVIVNRKLMKEPIVLNAPFIAVTGCLPPEVLPELSDERGREDGFVHRVLFAYPDLTKQQWTEDEIPSAQMEEFNAVFKRLFELEPASTEGETSPRVVRFSVAAKKCWQDWIHSHYLEQAEESFPPHFRGPWSKMEGYCARLALIIHYLRFVSRETEAEEVQDQDIVAAWSLIDFFKSHTKRVYAHLRTSPADRKAEATVSWLQKHNNQATVRDLVTCHVGNVKRASDARRLLKDLVDRGYGTLTRKGKREIFILYSTQHAAM